MSQVLDEISTAIKNLSLESSVVRVINDEDLYKNLLNHFVKGGDRRWWWESFNVESNSKSFSDGLGYKRLPVIVPDKDEVVWFMVEDDQLPNYPIFECSISNAVKIIGECFAFEYYLISKNLQWLLCENHHDRVIGIGSKLDFGNAI
ncbi:DUF6756 family protein [Litorilituus sediminis]|uniref:Uncharacterized protein n=1 Tax=Litorilituus sediminis TaxID=718192 RepID=A0A4P6P514_9GAMM|nr:DUF6756 family protein [Litorilituus sediminis]QBG34442.1 hypothetical protein EMK97_01165 [Litorilituus sediminis]